MDELDVLRNIAPSPELPLEATPYNNRLQIEKQMGIELPECVFQLASIYGTGVFQTASGADFQFYNPYSKWYYQNLIRFHSLYETHKREFGDEYLPYRIYPDKPGLLMCGSGSNRQAFFWLTEGIPNSWPIIYLTPDQEIGIFDGTLIAFLVKILTGKMPAFYQTKPNAKSFGGQEEQVVFVPVPPFDIRKYPPPHEDAALGNLPGLQYAINSGLDLESKDDVGKTVLFTAIEYRKGDAVDLLLQNGANPNAIDQRQNTPLIWACGFDDAYYMINSLLQAGAAVDARNSFGETALLVASRRKAPDVVRLLLQHGANPNAKDDTGRSALEWARKDETTQKLLLDAGAK